jgi:hypothetical protein
VKLLGEEVDSSTVIPRRSANTPGWTIYVYGHQVGVPSSEHVELHGKATICVGGRKGRMLHGGVHPVV